LTAPIFVTFGLAASLTGVFSAAGDFVKGRQKAAEQSCSIAEQFVLDEIPSPALSAAQRARLNTLAVHKVEQCMGEAR